MNLTLDPEVIGEVLIPLKNGSFSSNSHPPTFQDLFSCSYKSFRNILFQGETLKFYIVLKSPKQKSINLSNFFDKIFFKIEFQPNDIDKNLNINNGEESDDSENNREIEYNFYSSNKNDEKKISEIKKDEFEEINNKIYDEETCSEVFEIIKEIIVPENFINYNFLMKISLYLENYNEFSENNGENNILNLYQLGMLNNINNYRYFKIIFKEVKIINALNILKMKQLDQKIDTSLILTKILNNNESFEFYDTSLKNSKIFKNMKEVINNENTNKYDKKISINDIRILKYESCFDEKITDDIEFIKKILIKEKKLLNKNDFEISIFNKINFPLNIFSGEEFNLLFKITKNSYINEYIYSTNKINKNNIKEKNKSIYLLTQGESNSQNDVNKIIINSINDPYFSSSIFFNNKTLEDKDNSNPLNLVKKYSVMLPYKQSKSISQKIQEPLFSLGNLLKKKITFNEIKEEKESNNNEDISNLKSNQKINTATNKSKSEDNEITANNNNQYLDLDTYFDEHFKIYYITPIILELESDFFYENINMCIYLKWFNEINRYLKISISIPEHIYINQYFEVKIKITNISLNPMNLIIQIRDNENKQTKLLNQNKTKIIESVPCILSQTKIEHFGLIDCGDEKIYHLKFLPFIKGFCYLPNLTLIDIYSDKQFYIVQNNKIYVEENKL